jgi:hypothetical protein
MLTKNEMAILSESCEAAFKAFRPAAYVADQVYPGEYIGGGEGAVGQPGASGEDGGGNEGGPGQEPPRCLNAPIAAPSSSPSVRPEGSARRHAACRPTETLAFQRRARMYLRLAFHGLATPRRHAATWLQPIPRLTRKDSRPRLPGTRVRSR